MRVTFFRAADDKWTKPWDVSWEDLVQRIKKEGHLFVDVPPPPSDIKSVEKWEQPYKLAQPLISPCEFREGTRRAIENAVQVHFGVLDMDHMSMDQLADFIRQAQGSADMEGAGQGGQPLELVLWTSWKHSPDNVSMRAIFPFTHAVPANQWSGFWPRMNHHLGGFGDVSLRPVERGYFLPSTSRDRAAHAEIIHFPGAPLDVDAIGLLEIPATALAKARGGGSVKVSREEIVLFSKALKKKNPETGTAMERVIQGEPWAEPGVRDTVLFKLAGDLAKAFPHADPASIASHFSLCATHFPDPAAELAKVTEKIQRRQGEILESQERKERETLAARRLAIRMAFRAEDGRDTPYTEAEVETFAAWGHTDVDHFRRRWILQKGGGFYFFVGYPVPRYVGPFSKEDGKLAAHTYLAPATSVGVRLEELTITGDFIQRPAQDLAMDYGVVAEAVVADMTATATHLEPATATVVEAPCPLRPLVPTYHPGVDRWLRLLAGATWSTLELWLAYVIDLRRPCVALFLEGSKDAGKSLLAKGLARLWRSGPPTTLDQAMGGFNSALASCPLVFADEKIPKDFRGRPRTQELREFLQLTSRDFRRKHLPDAILVGASRTLIAANNRDILGGEDNLTTNDIEAINERFAYIQCNAEPGKYLRSLDTWGEGWVDSDVIARHVLWMVQTVHKPANPPRFLVPVGDSALARSMATSTNMGSAVAHWLVSFLLNPEKLRGGRPPGDSAHLVRVHRGVLHVAPRALTDHWTAYATNVPVDRATVRAVAQGIRGISPTHPDERVSLPVPGFPTRNRPKFYAIRTEDMVEWANNHGYASTDEILLALQGLAEKDQASEAHALGVPPLPPGVLSGPWSN